MLQIDGDALLVATGLVATFHLILLVRGVSKNYRQQSTMGMIPNSVTAFMVIGGLVLILASTPNECIDWTTDSRARFASAPLRLCQSPVIQWC